MRSKRLNYSPALKAKVALETLKEEKTLVQLASKYDVHFNQIQTWRNNLKDNMVSVLVPSTDKRKDHEGEV